MTSLASERRAARERALGLLYEAEAKGRTSRDVVQELPVQPDAYTVALLDAVDAHRERIDSLISRFARGWSIERMPALDRAATRLGTAELLERNDVPTAVVLAEIVDLAGRFSTEGSGRFVNGLLARIAEEVRGDVGSGPAVPPAPAERAVDGLVIDLDGVIRHWEREGVGEVEDELGVPRGALSAVALDTDLLDPAMDGRLSFEAWCDEVGARVAAAHGVDREAAAHAWAATPWRIDLAVLDLVRAVRRSGRPVALLSNASTRLEDDLARSGIADEFDAVVGSAAIGVTKPDPAAFRAAAEAITTPPARCLFVDDVEANVEGARSAGMRAARFEDVEHLRTLLEEVGLL